LQTGAGEQSRNDSNIESGIIQQNYGTRSLHFLDANKFQSEKINPNAGQPKLNVWPQSGANSTEVKGEIGAKSQQVSVSDDG